jgi:hypothetical protein
MNLAERLHGLLYPGFDLLFIPHVGDAGQDLDPRVLFSEVAFGFFQPFWVGADEGESSFAGREKV